MHPMIKPALRRGWRDRQTVQYGVTAAHALLLGPVDNATAALLDLFDGTRSMDQLRNEARRLGVRPEKADHIAERLALQGALDDATYDREASASIGEGLRADLASLTAVHRGPGSGVRRLSARRHAKVQVRGAGKVGASVAATLSAAGVGQVEVVDGGVVEPWDTSPAGLSPEQVGSRRDAAARSAVRRTKQAKGGAQSPVSLVIVAPRDGLDAYAPDPRANERFVAAGTPHLFGGVVEGTGVVGPLVLPGRSPCAECLLRANAVREPSWPLVVGQWRTAARRRAGVPPCDTALATLVSGAVTSHALSFVDGDGACCAGYRMRFTLPHLLSDTDLFAPHPECPCGAASVPEETEAGHPAPSTPTMAG
ncbi:ThiF family adenylyltransferase [Streptomyces xiaopingdaonensis]|uniref:ThiF family adenylyltransferase n=1 Tax=Streptomyces xiaopingdaonensis TaxID=1565415 RepID=UPI00030158C5